MTLLHLADLQLGHGDALLLVDVQLDLLPGGARPILGGEEIVPLLNRALHLFYAAGLPVFAARRSERPGARTRADDGSEAPPPCIEGTAGARLSPDLGLMRSTPIVARATAPERDAYSAFADTDLKERLVAAGVRHLFVGGLGTEQGVFDTVRDALERDVMVSLLTDAVRAAEPERGRHAVDRLLALGAIPIECGPHRPPAVAPPRTAGAIRYALPELPYAYDALEPLLSARTLELHHDRHHRAYVDGANRAMGELRAARRRRDFARIEALERALAFHVSGHLLHAMYWQNLSPDGGGRPSGALATAIDRDFGGLAPFRAQLTEVAATVMGSGWAALVYDPLTRRLGTTQIHDHQSQITQAGIPLLVVDAWEHAYYLQYQSDKARYLAALWELWCWDDVQARYQAALALDLRLRGVASLVPGLQPG